MFSALTLDVVRAEAEPERVRPDRSDPGGEVPPESGDGPVALGRGDAPGVAGGQHFRLEVLEEGFQKKCCFGDFPQV